MINNKLIRSKRRVRSLAEVFTEEREVRSMLDLVKYLSENIEHTFLEPSCGSGNFLLTILKRKLDTIKVKYRKQSDVEFYIIKAVASIYGVDISKKNITEARQRMLYEIKNFYPTVLHTKKPNKDFWNVLDWVLKKNIITGDMLNKFDNISFIEYTTPKRYYFKRQEFKLVDQTGKANRVMTLFDKKRPFKNYKITHYLKLCS